MKIIEKKKFNENSAVRYIKMMGKMYIDGNFNPEAKDYWKWQIKVTTPVRLVSYKKIPGMAEKVEEFLKYNDIIKKECYYNSIKVVWDIDGVEYVEGVANLMIPISHGWNCYKGQHFDLTAEILLGIDVEREDYAQVIKLDRREVCQMVNRTKVAGEFIPEYYIDKIKR